MKIAVACMGESISGHFGHCQNYKFFNTEGNKIVSVEDVVSPEHKPGALPVFLAAQGANVIIAGGMGDMAVKLFNQNDIEVIVGIAGDAKEAVEKYLNGELESTGSICHEHSFEDDECNH